MVPPRITKKHRLHNFALANGIGIGRNVLSCVSAFSVEINTTPNWSHTRPTNMPYGSASCGFMMRLLKLAAQCQSVTCVSLTLLLPSVVHEFCPNQGETCGADAFDADGVVFGDSIHTVFPQVCSASGGSNNSLHNASVHACGSNLNLLLDHRGRTSVACVSQMLERARAGSDCLFHLDHLCKGSRSDQPSASRSMRHWRPARNGAWRC